MKKWCFFSSADGANDSSPRRQPRVSGQTVSRPSQNRDGSGSETRGFKLNGAALAVLLFATQLFAAAVAADFSAANKFYAEGKFALAATAYQTILQTGAQSPALWFNAGSAEFKAGHLGKSIAAYRQAELLAPRDAELRANLAFVRNQVQGATLHESRWQNWVGVLTLNEGTLLTAVFFWTLLALLTARQIRPTLAPQLRRVTRLAMILTLFSSAILALQADVTSLFRAS